MLLDPRRQILDYGYVKQDFRVPSNGHYIETFSYHRTKQYRWARTLKLNTDYTFKSDVTTPHNC